ncbi:MAG: hypothetical protein ACFFBD_08125 [Candidatus Hodarchaeota archaeon]
MPIDKKKVNRLLLRFQDLLKQEKPSLEELKLISNKIHSLILRLEIDRKTDQPKISDQKKRPKQPTKKWYHVEIE